MELTAFFYPLIPTHIIDYALFTCSFMLSNIQFGYIAVILSLPIFDLIAPTSTSTSPLAGIYSVIKKIILFPLLLVSSPSLVFFTTVGMKKVGILQWLLATMIAYRRYGSTFYLLLVNWFLPLIAIASYIVFFAKDRQRIDNNNNNNNDKNNTNKSNTQQQTNRNDTTSTNTNTNTIAPKNNNNNNNNNRDNNTLLFLPQSALILPSTN